MILLASDYDGTLKKNGKIAESDLDAIYRFQNQENCFAIITGRSVAMTRGELEKYKIPFDYLICGNGAIIVDKHYHILKRFDLDYSMALSLIEDVKKEENVSYGISDGDRFGAGLIENKAVDLSDEMFDDVSDYMAILNDKQIAMIYIQHETEEKTLLLKERLERKYQGQAAFYFNKGAISVSSALVSKKTGVESLAKQINGQVYTIGDGYNDLPMIEAFHGYSVVSAPEAVKSKASVVFDTVKDCLNYLMEK